MVAVWVLVVLLLCAPAVSAAETLRIGTSGDYAPFSKDGTGFDIDVAALLGADLGIEIEWVPFSWPELRQRVASSDLDLVMSGVTWRADRAVVGWMTRAVASGGPCLLSRDESRARIGVNRGGFLENWARERYGERVISVDDNLALPGKLAAGEVDAIVTDSFELPHFQAPGVSAECERARYRKVYWIAPKQAQRLGPRLDDWLARREPELDRLRAEHFGGPSARTEADHLLDLMARRLALMPLVGTWKRANAVPISDPARERLVLDRVADSAREAGLDPGAVQELFRVQIELAKALQIRDPLPPPSLRLREEIRPLLLQLGSRIVASLVRLQAAGASDSDLVEADWAPLNALLEPAEGAELRRALALTLGKTRESPGLQRPGQGSKI